jgi:ubiquinone/menaquinone biosynthesis C-methylase UbiE
MLTRDKLAIEALVDNGNVLDIVSKHHSYEVMQYELRKFLDLLPLGGVLVDVGTGFGWHWIELSKHRPDLVLCLLDFSYASLSLAQQLLQGKCGNQILFICGDALDLPFADGSIDGYWSVQTLQHVSSWRKAISEAHRVLKAQSIFASYSLNHQKLIEWIYKRINKRYVTNGEYVSGINIVRSSDNQYEIVGQFFGNLVEVRYSEIIYSPELLFTRPGCAGSMLGKIDRYLSGKSFLAESLGRQCSFHAVKAG